jgi:hypothetical protein
VSSWWDALKVDLVQADLDCAVAFAADAASRRVQDVHRRDLATTYWTDFEADQYGHICEHVFHRFSGEPLHCDSSRAHTGEADVGNWEVKGVPWRRIEHFHLSNGGRIPVPDYVRRPIVAVSYFLRSPMAGRVDGWMPWEQAIKFPLGGQVRGASGKRAHMIPYAKLLPASDLT